MRLPFPTRFPLWRVSVFAVVLCFVQVAQGTDPLFSLYCFLFIMLSAASFNVSGGFSTPSGTYVFFFSMFTVILGVCVKAFLGEAADSNLKVPMVTIKVYLGGACGLLVAVFMNRRLASRRGKLTDLLPLEKMNAAALGCLLSGLFLQFAPAYLPGGNGSLISALTQLNRFTPMALFLAVTYQIRKTGGRSTFNTTAYVAFGLSFVVEGLMNLSKAALFTPMLAWFICAAALRYRFSTMQAVGALFGCFMVFYYIVPYVQYTRSYVQTNPDSLAVRIKLLSNAGDTRQAYQEDERWNNDNAKYHYFNSAVGIFDRLQTMSIDDAIISVTDPEHPFGLAPVWANLLNAVPRVFWPNKPTIGFGNVYAHEIGILPPDDESTGVSFSPVADAFHMARWIGVLVLCPIVWIVLFITFDSLCGDTRESPWALFMAAAFAHVAPESMVGGLIYLLTFGLAALLFLAFFSAYILPVIGRVFSREDQPTRIPAPVLHGMPPAFPRTPTR